MIFNIQSSTTKYPFKKLIDSISDIKSIEIRSRNDKEIKTKLNYP